jgi:hypothetical protein
MLINIDILREKILDRFGTQAKFAKAIGYSETQINRSLHTQSPKFLLACKKAGIKIDELIEHQTKLKETGSNKKIKELMEKINELNEIIESQKMIIEQLKEIIRIKDGINKGKK